MVRRFLWLICLPLLLLACEKGEVNGIEDNDIPKSLMLGGWGVQRVEFQLVYDHNNPIAQVANSLNLKQKMQEKLESRAKNKSLYFMQDTIYCIETPAVNVSYVKAQSYYTISSYPATIHPENKTLFCDSYAEYFYAKMQDDMLCLYLTKGEVLKMIKEDGSVSSSHVSLIERVIEDAQFEIYFSRNHLALYDELEIRYGGGATD